MKFEEGSLLWHYARSPWVRQPNPEKLEFVGAKAMKLIRRGPDYFIVGKHADGTEVEGCLIPGVFTNFAKPS